MTMKVTWMGTTSLMVERKSVNAKITEVWKSDGSDEDDDDNDIYMDRIGYFTITF